jgi:hypothetical protein
VTGLADSTHLTLAAPGTLWPHAPGISVSQAGAAGSLAEAPLLAGLDPLMVLSRSLRTWVSVTYVGGVTPGALPYDLAQACIWVTSELLAERRNPSGAARIRQGKFELQARPWGDRSGDSTLLLQAKAALEPYRAQAL